MLFQVSKYLPNSRVPHDKRCQMTLAAARKVFAKCGFAGARTGEIAREAQISEAMLFKLYGDKEGLYKAILEDQIAAESVDDLPQAAADAGDAYAVFDGVAKKMLHAVRSDTCFYRLLFSSALEGHPLSAAFASARIERRVTFLANFVTQRQNAGVFRSADAQTVALGFLGMVHQYLQIHEIFALPGYEDLNGEAYCHEIVTVIIRGLLTDPTDQTKALGPKSNRPKQMRRINEIKEK